MQCFCTAGTRRALSGETRRPDDQDTDGERRVPAVAMFAGSEFRRGTEMAIQDAKVGHDWVHRETVGRCT